MSARALSAALASSVAVLFLAGATSSAEAQQEPGLPGSSAQATIPPLQENQAEDSAQIASGGGPSTPILDDFNRPNESPLSQGGAWVPTDPRGLGNTLSVLSMQAGNTFTGVNSISYRGTFYPGDVEVYATIPQKPGNNLGVSLLFGIQSEGSTLWDAYYLTWDDLPGTDILRIEIISNNQFFQNLVTTQLEMSAGDKFMARKVGTQLEGWVNQGGTWTKELEGTDSNFLFGKIGARIGSSPPRLDDFGGGVPVPPPPSPTITTTSLPSGTVGQPYSQPVTASGGTTPYIWTLSAGTLPPGLSLSPSGTPSATIAGTPTSVGTYNFTVRVTDSASTPASDTQDLSIYVGPPPPSGSAPDPPLLDNFNRSPESPVSQSGNWAPIGINGGSGAPLSQNKLRNFPQPGYSYRVTPYLGGDVEAAARIANRPSGSDSLSVFINLQDAGTASWDGYELRATNVNGGPDLWQIWRIGNGVSNPPTPLASTNFEITTDGTMLLRRIGGWIQFWWKPAGGTWTQKLVGELALYDLTYQWGMIGAGGVNSGALEDFGGGSLLSLLDQYAPQLRFTSDEVYRSVDAAIATDLHFPDPDHSNLLKRPGAGGATIVAAADPSYSEDNLSLAYLGSSAQPGDFLDQPNYSGDPVLSAATDYSFWVTDANRQSYNRKVYGRRLTSGGQTLLQYWIFYYYNPKDPGGVGKHEGDWELTQVRLNQLGVPSALTYAQHGSPEKCLWGPNVEVSTSGRTIAYVAYESHATYFWAGSHSAPVTPDITRDDGQLYYEVPDVVDVSTAAASTPLAWILWDGRWGGSDWAGVASPKSPGQQDPWLNPWTWDQSASCSLRPLALARRSTEVASPNLDGVPPLPQTLKARIVTGTKYGRAVRVSYCFGSLPSEPARRPARLHLTVDNLRDGFPPLSKGWVVRRRCATVIHPVGGIRAPYVLRYSVESRRGTWSKQITKALR